MRTGALILMLGGTLMLLPACGDDLDPDEPADAIPEGVSLEPTDEVPATGGVSLEGNVTVDTAAALQPGAEAADTLE